MLHSPALTRLHREGASLLLTLSFENGACCAAKDFFHSVRDYAVELLKPSCWQIFFREKERTSIEGFIGKYARFCLQLLLRWGLWRLTARRAVGRL